MTAVMAVFVRYNSAFLFLILIGMIFDHAADEDRSERPPRAFIATVCISTTLCILILVPLFFIRGYGGTTFIIPLFRQLYLKWFVLSLLGGDGFFWKVTWLMPVLFIGLVRIRNLSWAGRASLLAILFQLTICIGWNPFVVLPGSYMTGCLVCSAFLIRDLGANLYTNRWMLLSLGIAILSGLAFQYQISFHKLIVSAVTLNGVSFIQSIKGISLLGATPIPVCLDLMLGKDTIWPGVLTPISYHTQTLSSRIIFIGFVILMPFFVAVCYRAMVGRTSVTMGKKP